MVNGTSGSHRSRAAEFVVMSCSDDEAAERPDISAVCALNDEFADLNERTIPDIEPGVAYHDAAALEENFVEGVRLMRQMVADVPGEIRYDLAAYTDSIDELSEMYADFGYDQATVWENADYETYEELYQVPDEVRARIGDWFIDNCGMDLQG